MSALTVICCFVLMLASLTGESSVEICAYTGQKVKLSIIGNDCQDPSLYKENGTTIASWEDDSIDYKYVNPNYEGRIHMDKDRIIWLKAVEKKDAGRYDIKCGIHKQFGIELIVMGLTEEQRQECPNNRPDFPKEGYDSCNSGMLLAILIIFILDKILTNIFSETYIRKGWITGKNWIQKRFCSLDRKTEQLHQPDEITRVPIEKLELTEDQVQCWLNDHPDFVEKHYGNMEDRMQKSLSILLGSLLVKKSLDPHDIVVGHDTVSSQVTPIIPPNDLGVNERFPEVVSGEEENQNIVSVDGFARNNSPHMRPERNVRSDRWFTSEDPDLDSANPLLGEENLRRN